MRFGTYGVRPTTVEGSGERRLISEDEHKKRLEEVQKITDNHIKEIDKLAGGKEKEIMEI